MNENSELILYIYQNVSMGVESTTNLINILNSTDNKIKKIVEGELKGYENFLKKAEKLMKKYKVEKQDRGMMAKLGAKMGMSMELMKDNSDAKVADMLTKGFMAGEVDITKRIDMYKDDAASDIISLAKDILKFSKENIDLLKPYL